MYSNIVVGTDGSPTAKTALTPSPCDLAHSGATIHIVSAYRSKGAPITVGTEAESWTVDDHQRVDAGARGGGGDRPHQGPERRDSRRRTRPGGCDHRGPGEVGADVVVVGNKGMKGAKRFLLGSVPNKVAHNAPCTVSSSRRPEHAFEDSFGTSVAEPAYRHAVGCRVGGYR